MFSGMQDDLPLLLSSILTHAEQFHGKTEIVSRSVEGGLHRYTYGDCGRRSRQLAKALIKLGVTPENRVASLAWNTWRHLELWYGVAGMGACIHTVNPRLFDEQLVYIINHADNKYVFLDLTFVDLVERIAPQLTSVEGYVIMTDRAHMPDSKLPNLMCYEDLLAEQDDDYAWPLLDERQAAGLCYTSGTTGNPKGVLYSNRSSVLHAMAGCTVDTLGASATKTIMPVVPMFHANGWGIAHAAPMAGCKLVLPGRELDGPNVYELLDKEKVNLTAAVPTVWLALLNYLQVNNLDLPYMERVVIGGSAAPRSMIEAFEKKYDVQVGHIWGMTEMNPMGSIGAMNGRLLERPYEEQMTYKLKQGRGLWGVQYKITDDDGNKLPWDGKTSGHLMVKGHWVIGEYFKGVGGQVLDQEGFFDTGDIAVIDDEGFLQLTDRAKDVIKSGGEWISSIDLENEAVGHPDIAEAAVIGIYHPKWDERPLLVLVKEPGKDVSKDDVLEFLKPKIAKWWMPDDVVFVDEIPHTATGKIQKTRLRETFKDYKLPTI